MQKCFLGISFETSQGVYSRFPTRFFSGIFPQIHSEIHSENPLRLLLMNLTSSFFNDLINYE